MKWRLLGFTAIVSILGLALAAHSEVMAMPGAFVLGSDPAFEWTHLSCANGDLPPPSNATQQTASLILDVDRDGRDDFVIGSRQAGPAMVWYRRDADGWTK